MNPKYNTTEAYIYAYLQNELTNDEKIVFHQDIETDKEFYEEYIEIRVRNYLLLLKKEEVGVLNLKEKELLEEEKVAFKKELLTNTVLKEEYNLQLSAYHALQQQKLSESYKQNLPFIQDIISKIPTKEIEEAIKSSFWDKIVSYRYYLYFIVPIFLLLSYYFISYKPTQENKGSHIAQNDSTNINDSSKMSSETHPKENLAAEKDSQMPPKKVLPPFQNSNTPSNANDNSKSNSNEVAKENKTLHETLNDNAKVNEGIKITSQYDNLIKLQEGVCYYMNKWVEYDKKHTTSGMANPNFKIVNECEAKIKELKQQKESWSKPLQNQSNADIDKIIVQLTQQEQLLAKELNKHKKACSERGLK